MTAIERVIRILLGGALLAAPLAHASDDLIDLRDAPPVRGDAVAGKAKAAVCSACHGPLGVAVVPTFPNLAGQKADYLYWRLVTFKRAGDADSPMTAQVAHLDDAAMRDLAAWFASLEPAAGTNGAAGMPGATIYRDGDPARGVPPCQGCHGLDARARVGADDAARARLYPVLRGQHAAYLADRLEDLATHPPHTSTAHVMAPIARTLDAASIEAITHWLEAGAP
ncbi:c-type cytochrome [Dokdonella fugitiva]|jgi:cytochrome c553|uniref:Cytochrome c553 n=1 Tax=Dokdonella fugitiva TaxID=328517 RepID=A0A4R2I8G5_9GAMM|nr:c-type cytochrome [Dokdonella fugitiva]MBA8883308.1 cytochrome c553 [Dokdonella fugitiva]TCO40246.1 cytochrome c553 [Dokdonella fugitiva]